MIARVLDRELGVYHYPSPTVIPASNKLAGVHLYLAILEISLVFFGKAFKVN